VDSQVAEVDMGHNLVVALEANMVAVLKGTTYFLLE